MQLRTKQPFDQIDEDVDFSKWLPAGDTITTATVTYTGPDTVLVINGVQLDDQNYPLIAKVWQSAGTDLATYKITVNVATAGGRVKQLDYRLRVKDI